MFPAVIAISVVCITLSPLTMAKDKKIPQQEINFLKHYYVMLGDVVFYENFVMAFSDPETKLEDVLRDLLDYKDFMEVSRGPEVKIDDVCQRIEPKILKRHKFLKEIQKKLIELKPPAEFQGSYNLMRKTLSNDIATTEELVKALETSQESDKLKAILENYFVIANNYQKALRETNKAVETWPPKVLDDIDKYYREHSQVEL
jgi:hypothetical protein